MINLNRIKGIIVTPKKEWEQISVEQSSPSSLATSYVLPLLAIGVVACLICYGLIGTGGFRSFNFGIRFGLIHALSAGLAVAATAWGIDMLAPNFQSQKNMMRSTQLAVYAFTPFLLASILFIIPSYTIHTLVQLAGLYGIYIMYEGFSLMKPVAEDKKMPYMFASIGIMIGSYIIFYWIMFEILRPRFSFSDLLNMAS